MLSPGNHEAPCQYAEYEARAGLMPHWGSGSSDMQYYSYTIGQVHVVALSGEGGRLDSINSTEVQWLEADLAAASAARARGQVAWIVTHVHYPNVPAGYCSSMMTYCCANGRQGLRRELEGRERFQNLSSSASDALDGAHDIGCVDSFMTPLNKYVEDLYVSRSGNPHCCAIVTAWRREHGDFVAIPFTRCATLLEPKYRLQLVYGSLNSYCHLPLPTSFVPLIRSSTTWMYTSRHISTFTSERHLYTGTRHMAMALRRFRLATQQPFLSNPSTSHPIAGLPVMLVFLNLNDFCFNASTSDVVSVSCCFTLDYYFVFILSSISHGVGPTPSTLPPNKRTVGFASCC